MTDKHLFYLNMRFLTQRITGVQRFAFEITKALDVLLSDSPQVRLIGLLPNRAVNAQYQIYQYKNIILKPCGKLSGHLWEQLELPYYSYNHVLINLCNASPILKSRKYIALHDVIFMTTMDSQKWWFKAWYKLQVMTSKITCKHWFTVSDFSKREIGKYLKIRFEHITVLGNAPSLNPLTPDSSILDKFALQNQQFFLMIGSNSKRKNTQIVANVFKNNHILHNVKLVIAGGRYANLGEVEEIAAKNIYYLDYVSDEQLLTLYKSAYALVFPSLYEGFGIPVIEAMGVGCPVIAADIPVLREVCADSSIFFNPTSSADLLEEICLILDISCRLKLSAASILRATSYTWSKFAKIMLDKIIQVEKNSK